MMKIFVKCGDVINSFPVTDEDVKLLEKAKYKKPSILDMIKVNSQDEWFITAGSDEALFIIELILRKDIIELFKDSFVSSDVDDITDSDDFSFDILKPSR